MPTEPNTRERLLAVAMTLFWENGYGATSIQDILRQADVHAGSLDHVFPTKQELLAAVLERYRDALYPMLVDPAWADVSDPIERIFALLAKYRALLVMTDCSYDCSYGCPIGSLALELHEPDPPVRALLAANFDRWTQAIERCLNDAGSRIPKDVNRRELASFVLTTMEGSVMQARTPPHHPHVRRRRQGAPRLLPPTRRRRRHAAPCARTKATSAVKSEVTRGRKKSIRSASPRRSA